MTNVYMDRLLWLPSARATQKLVDDLTFVPRYSSEMVELFEMRNGSIGIPLHHFNILGKDAIKDNRVDGREVDFSFTSSFRSGQHEVVHEFERKKAKGHTGFIIKAVPGWGKTCVAIKLISLLRCTTLVVVPRSNLIKQWVERLLEHSDLEENDIGIAEAGKADWIGKKIVIGLVHTLAKDRFGNPFKNHFGAVVFDEVDRSVPPATFSSTASMFPARYRIGVSATMERQDKMDIIFFKHIGQCFIQAVDNRTLKPKVILRKFDMDSGYVHPFSQKMNRRGMLLSKLAENYTRNYELSKYTDMIYRSGRQVIVISDRIKQLQVIYGLLHMQFQVQKEDMGYYVRTLYTHEDKKITVKKEERERVAKNCKIILASYGMLSLGTDIPSLAGLVMATPQSDIVQTVGRIVREMEGKQKPLVVDFVDTHYRDAIGWAMRRKKYYFTEKLFVQEVM